MNSRHRNRSFLTYDRNTMLLYPRIIKRLKGKNADLLIREFTLADGRRSFLLLVDGMCSKQSAEQNLILPAMQLRLSASPDSIPPMKQLSSLILNTELSEQPSLSKGFIAALTGDLFLCIEGLNVGFVIGARSIESRSVSPSETAGSVVGPHEGFTENLRTNTALIRRRISDPNLTIEMLQVGLRSHTAVAVCYINGVTNETLIDTVRKNIQANGITFSGLYSWRQETICVTEFMVS